MHEHLLLLCDTSIQTEDVEEIPECLARKGLEETFKNISNGVGELDLVSEEDDKNTEEATAKDCEDSMISKSVDNPSANSVGELDETSSYPDLF